MNIYESTAGRTAEVTSLTDIRKMRPLDEEKLRKGVAKIDYKIARYQRREQARAALRDKVRRLWTALRTRLARG